jgi:hypothetical protein
LVIRKNDGSGDRIVSQKRKESPIGPQYEREIQRKKRKTTSSHESLQKSKKEEEKISNEELEGLIINGSNNHKKDMEEEEEEIEDSVDIYEEFNYDSDDEISFTDDGLDINDIIS